MKEYLIISNTNEEIEVKNKLYYKRWDFNLLRVVELIVIFELVVVLERRVRHREEERIIIGLIIKRYISK